jgi:hypothetical protein
MVKKLETIFVLEGKKRKKERKKEIKKNKKTKNKKRRLHFCRL